LPISFFTSDILLQSNREQIAFPLDLRGFGSSEGLPHFTLLVIHHFADPRATSADDGCTDGTTEEGGLDVTADGLSDNRPGNSPTSSSVKTALLGFGLGAAGDNQ
jgi:hypothetical protein